MIMELKKNLGLKIGVICPTYNAGDSWEDWIQALNNQSVKVDDVVIIDSSSSDQTPEMAKKSGFIVKTIDKKLFNHGGTRNNAVKSLSKKVDILIFLTQDAVLNSKESIKSIITPFKDKQISAVCGRQIPHRNADPIASHSRHYNYSAESHVNTKQDIEKNGLKTAYMSNSFAAYRLSAFNKCEGFPEDLIFGEDMYLSAKMLLMNFKTFYCAEAVVRHSHNYSLFEEFKRYFDIGVFHKNQKFLLENFGKPHGEGLKYAISELRYCYKISIFWMFRSMLGTLTKFVGYKLGNNYSRLPHNLVIRFSMHTGYWVNK